MKHLSDSLACIITGPPNSGTSIFNLVLSMHPNLVSPIEYGLMKEKPLSNYVNSIYYKRGHFKALGLTKEDMDKVLSADTLQGAYETTRVLSPLISNERLIDKCPAYFYKFNDLSKVTSGIPWIILKKDPRNYTLSRMKRGQGHKHVKRIYKKYNAFLEDSNKYKVVIFEEFLENPYKVLEEVCSFIKVEFSESFFPNLFSDNTSAPFNEYYRLPLNAIVGQDKISKKHLSFLRNNIRKEHFISGM